jgi:hypothetical protein
MRGLITAYWSVNPAARPTFTEIYEGLKSRVMGISQRRYIELLDSFSPSP